MLGFIMYGGKGPDGSEEEVAVDDMERVEGAEEKADDEDGGGRCPLPAAGCLRRSEPTEGNMDCRSASVCPGVWRNEDPAPGIRSG